MIGVIRTVIFIVGLYYVIRFISRHILPLFTEEKKAPVQGTQYQRHPRYSKDEGEYVDFEEIK